VSSPSSGPGGPAAPAVLSGPAVLGGPAGPSSGEPVRGVGVVAWQLMFVVTAGAGVVLAAMVASGRPILASRWSMLTIIGLWGLAWVAAVVAAWHLPRRVAVAWILVAGAALRLATLAGPPTTSDDLYRYTWDGRVQAAGIDPYAHPPDSPALSRLREPWLWPDPAGCAALHRPAGCTRINRPGQRTIYPPVAEMWFAAAYHLGGVGSRHKLWQVAGLATELAVLGLLPVALRRWDRDTRWCALYALCPAPALEIVNNGHIDGLAVFFTVAALAVIVPPAHDSRLSGPARDVVAGLFLGAAALVKLFPALLLVTVVGTRRGRRLPALLRSGGTAVALAVVTYLPHVLAVGPKVLGYLPGYLKEEHYEGGGRYLIAEALRLPPHLGEPLAVVAVVAAVAWVLARRPPVPTASALLLGVLLLAVSPVQPWYAVSLLAVATVAGLPGWAVVTVAGYPYFFAVILANRHMVGIGQTAYTAAAIVVAAVGLAVLLARRHRPRADQAATTGPMPEDLGSARPPVPVLPDGASSSGVRVSG